jgi:hypothetical protein
MSDDKGAALVLPALTKVKELLADRGYDADWFRQALIQKALRLVSHLKRTAKFPPRTTKSSTSSAHKVGNRFGRLKDWLAPHRHTL